MPRLGGGRAAAFVRPVGIVRLRLRLRQWVVCGREREIVFHVRAECDVGEVCGAQLRRVTQSGRLLARRHSVRVWQFTRRNVR